VTGPSPAKTAPVAKPTPPAAPVEPPPPPQPSVWQAHVQPLLLEYWYLVAGLVLIVAGASLLAYLTWDKSPVWRYSIMPSMLFGFTVLLAELGHWLHRQNDGLRSTGLVLRAGALALLPVNAMAVGLVSKGSAGLI